MYVVVDPDNRDFLALDTTSKVFQGVDDRIAKLVELIINCGVCHCDPKPRQESVDEAVGVA